MYYPDQPFLIRTYKKSELAHLYNPNVCLKVALQILRRWIVYNLPLLQELEQEGYRARNRLLLPGKWQRSYAIWENPRNLIKKTKSSILLFYKQISLQPQIKKNKPTWSILPSFKTFTAS